MHDWSYHLGFTEETFNLQKDNFGLGGLGNDHEQGNAQAGGVSGGPASGFAARDNANQITPPDGQAPITNMYLWQPIAGAFYPLRRRRLRHVRDRARVHMRSPTGWSPGRTPV